MVTILAVVESKYRKLATKPISIVQPQSLIAFLISLFLLSLLINNTNCYQNHSLLYSASNALLLPLRYTVNKKVNY